MPGRRLAKGEKIRVLIVDDSVVIRQLVSHALGRSGAFELAGTAPNGVVALEMLKDLKPDVITLDVEMPEMDGIATLQEIRKRTRDTVVIMFSTLTERSARTTLQALAFGANDYVAKVSNVGSLAESLARLQEDLIPKLRQFFVTEEDQASPPPPPPVASRPTCVRTSAAARKRPPGAVAIGVSTGGPSALAEIMPMFPASMPVPVFIVQHMPAIFTRTLAERLQKLTELRVQEGAEGMQVRPGNVYLAPGNFHMEVKRKGGSEFIVLNQAQPENSCRPAVDVLFRSVNEVYNGAVVAVILTGMGQDGRLGTEALRSKGARVIAQDKNSSVVWGMPGAVVQAGLADSVLDLKKIVPEILKNLQERSV